MPGSYSDIIGSFDQDFLSMYIIPGFGLATEDANMRMELSEPSQSSQIQWGLQIQQIITIDLYLEETCFSAGHQLTPTV